MNELGFRGASRSGRWVVRAVPRVAVVTLLGGLATLVACGSSASSPGSDVPSNFDASAAATDGKADGSKPTIDPGIEFGEDGGFREDASESVDAFFAVDPPAMWCGPANFDAGPDASGPKPPPTPTGTLQCPSDKNLPGCPCTTANETAPCFTGPRAIRSQGICADGVTTCEKTGELTKAWGACKGEVLPKPGATLGADACKCFSKGLWDITNIAPCTHYSALPFSAENIVNADSTQSTGMCQQQNETRSPFWSTNTLKVDCAGHFKLCYTIKAGKFAMPMPTDPVVAESCTEGDYPVENAVVTFPPLPHWTSDRASAQAFFTNGGYGEQSVVGQSYRCEAVGDGSGGRRVFKRIEYCPAKCSVPENATLPECVNCGNGVSGEF
ncbi:MAG: hypothetical protein U0169_10200 [Polyangiaceae bacterium]